MLFSIIIPTYNRNDLLSQCLEKLLPDNQSIDASQYEIIVTDDTAEAKAEVFCREHFPNVIHTRGPQKGPAANRNHGASLANGEWLVFTDDDCLPDSGFLYQYQKAIIDNPDSKAFEGAILPDDWDLLKKDMAECPVNTTGNCFWSANIAVHKSLFWKVRGFDARFPIAANEDQALKILLSKQNQIIFLPLCKVIHPVRIRSLANKLSLIPVVESSQVLLDSILGKSQGQIYLNGLRIHGFSAIASLKHGHLKRCFYNMCGFMYRIFYIKPLFRLPNFL